MNRKRFHAGWLVAALLAVPVACPPQPAAAQYDKPAAEGQDDDELNALLRALLQQSEDRKVRYNVPQGDVAALTEFISRLAQFRPQEPADQVEHQRRFRLAMQEAAERIIKQEKDRDSEAYQAARFILLQNRIYWLAQAVPAEQRRAVADVKDYLKERLKRGDTRAATSLAETAARMLQRIGQWDEAIALYKSYAAQCSNDSNADVSSWGDAMRGEADRLRTMNSTAPKPAASDVSPQGKLTPIDLSRLTNWSTSDWKRGAFEGNGLAELPKGQQTLGGVSFAIEERWLQLGGPFRSPQKIEGITVGRKLRRLYLLQGAQGSSPSGTIRADGALLATYKIRYADGSEESVPVELGKDVRNWFDFDQGMPVTRGRVVWTGSNTRASQRNVTLRLYLGAWNNPHPEKPVATIDFTKPEDRLYAPFCVALTAEE
jgi:hypothetical protein